MIWLFLNCVSSIVRVDTIEVVFYIIAKINSSNDTKSAELMKSLLSFVYMVQTEYIKRARMLSSTTTSDKINLKKTFFD